MKALLSTVAGGPETLTLGELPMPSPGPGQVRIAIAACGVNYPDVLIIQDRYQMRPPRPFAPGMEVAGVVDAVGAGVTHLQIGTRVLAANGVGGMAEYVLANEQSCVVVPDGIPLDEAAAMLTTYGTSYHALHDRAHLQGGETLLVLGAAGGVGLAAVELGKAAGARVIAAASSEDKVALARKHGADGAVVYPSGPMDKARTKQLAEDFKAACGGDGAHVIYDAVGGAYSEPALRAIAFEGRFLVVGFPAGIPQLPLNLPLLKACQIVGVFWGAAIARDPTQLQTAWREITRLHGQKALRPYISERYPLEEGGRAIARLAERQATGKIVITIGQVGRM
ncbi:MAG: NADPH:quinone oxidoreductase family protein [Steroidobacteraceae bacterium]